MKYRTFRMVFLGVVGLVVILGGFTVYRIVEERNEERRTEALKALREAQKERRAELEAQARAAADKAKAKPDAKNDAKNDAKPDAKDTADKPDGKADDKKPGDKKAAGDGLRPIDEKILAHLKNGFAGDRLKDVFPGEPAKVNVAREGGGFRIKIDLNRDGHWDEKWTTHGDDVKRQVAPADDEKYRDSYRLDGAGWRKK